MTLLKSTQIFFGLGCILLASMAPAAEPQSTPKIDRQTTGYLYGGGLFLSQSVYKEETSRFMAIPLLGYKGKQLSVFGPFISYDIVEKGNLTLFAQLAPRFDGFKASDSPIFDGMARRKNTLEAGLGYKLTFDAWQLKGSTRSELFGTSDGTEIQTTLSYRHRYGPFILTPELSLSYLSNDHVDYYYGVKSNESRLSRPFYRGVKTTNQSLGLTLATPLFFGGMSRITFTNTWLGSAIRNSPLVDTQSDLSLRLVFTKFF